MNKGLDLIQRQQIEAIDGYPTGNVYIGLTFEELAELEKELRALEVIRKKRVNARLIYRIDNDIQYNEKARQYYDCVPLIQEEFDLLKEVLLWINR